MDSLVINSINDDFFISKILVDSIFMLVSNKNDYVKINNKGIDENFWERVRTKDNFKKLYISDIEKIKSDIMQLLKDLDNEGKINVETAALIANFIKCLKYNVEENQYLKELFNLVTNKLNLSYDSKISVILNKSELQQVLGVALADNITYEEFFSFFINDKDLITKIFKNVNFDKLKDMDLYSFPIINGMYIIKSSIGNFNFSNSALKLVVKNYFLNNIYMDICKPLFIEDFILQLNLELNYLNFIGLDELNISSVDKETLLSIYDEVNINPYCEKFDSIYYIDKIKGDRLYKISKEDGKKEIIVNSKVQNFSINNNNIFYTLKHNGKIILVKCKLDGKDTQIISKNMSSSTAYCIEEDVIYYCEQNNYVSYIKAIDMNNKKDSVLYEVAQNISNLKCFNGNIYYKKQENYLNKQEVLKKLTKEDKQREYAEYTEEIFSKDMCLYKNYLAYIDGNSHSGIIKNLITGEKSHQIRNCNKILGVFNDLVFFTYEGFTDIETRYIEDMLYVFNLKTSEITKLIDKDIYSVQMIGDYIYYKVKNKKSTIYRQSIMGEDKKKISNYSKLNIFRSLF